jgi:hypothetical protein
MMIAAESLMLSGPWSSIDPAAIAVIAALETNIISSAVVASAAVAVPSANNE